MLLDKALFQRGLGLYEPHSATLPSPRPRPPRSITAPNFARPPVIHMRIARVRTPAGNARENRLAKFNKSRARERERERERERGGRGMARSNYKLQTDGNSSSWSRVPFASVHSRITFLLSRGQLRDEQTRRDPPGNPPHVYRDLRIRNFDAGQSTNSATHAVESPIKT